MTALRLTVSCQAPVALANRRAVDGATIGLGRVRPGLQKALDSTLLCPENETGWLTEQPYLQPVSKVIEVRVRSEFRVYFLGAVRTWISSGYRSLSENERA